MNWPWRGTTGDDAEALRRVREGLTGGLPADLDHWLVTPQQGVPMHQGTAVPILGMQMHQRPSGLLLPQSVVDPTPMDLFGTYITATEVLGTPFGPETIDFFLRGHTAWDMLVACAQLMHARDRDNWPDGRRQLIAELFKGDTAARLRTFVDHDGRVLLAPQLLLLVAAGCALSLPWQDAPEEPEGHPLHAAVLMCLHMADALGEATPRDAEGTAERDVLYADLVANQLFNSSTRTANDLVRHHRLWTEFLPAAAAAHNSADLSDAFHTATGIPMDVFQAVGFGVYTAIKEGGPIIDIGWFRQADLPDDEVRRVLATVSCSPDVLVSQLQKDVNGDLVENRWKLANFAQYPLLQVTESRWLVWSPQLLVDRFFSGLAFFDALAGAGKQREAVNTTWAFGTEQYGVDVLRQMVGDRMLDEQRLMDVYGVEGQRITDAVVDYGDQLLVVDFSSRRPAQNVARNPTPENVRREVDILLRGDPADANSKGKDSQLRGMIDALRSDLGRLGIGDGREIRRFVPVIVVHSLWPMNPVTRQLIDEILAEEGVLQEPDVARLEILTIEELEIAAAIAESDGLDLVSVLERKWQHGLAPASFRDHVFFVEKPSDIRMKGSKEHLDAFTRAMLDTLQLDKPGSEADA